MEKQTPETPIKTNKTSNHSHSGVMWLALLSLLVALLSVGGWIYIWKQSLENQMQTGKKILALQATLLQTQTAFVRQQRVLTSTQQDLQQVITQSQWKTPDWVFAESNYLLQRAVFSLTFEKNTSLARELLITADKRIQTLGTATTWPLRQALAADIVALSTAPTVDVPGVLMRINAISLQIEQLPRLAAPEKEVVNSVEISTPATWSWATLKDISLQIASSLKGLVAIHYDVPAAVPLLPPDQYVYVIANIQAQFALAQWAVLHRQAEVYQSSLDRAALWLNRYFPPDNAATKGLIAETQNLRAINVNPALPDLSRSIFAMHELWSKTSP